MGWKPKKGQRVSLRGYGKGTVYLEEGETGQHVYVPAPFCCVLWDERKKMTKRVSYGTPDTAPPISIIGGSNDSRARGLKRIK